MGDFLFQIMLPVASVLSFAAGLIYFMSGEEVESLTDTNFFMFAVLLLITTKLTLVYAIGAASFLIIMMFSGGQYLINLFL